MTAFTDEELQTLADGYFIARSARLPDLARELLEARRLMRLAHDAIAALCDIADLMTDEDAQLLNDLDAALTEGK